MLLYFLLSFIALNVLIWGIIISALHLSGREDDWSEDIESILSESNVADCDESRQFAPAFEN